MRQLHSATRHKRMQNAAAIESPKGIAPLPFADERNAQKTHSGTKCDKNSNATFPFAISLNSPQYRVRNAAIPFCSGAVYFAPRAERKRRESASRKGKNERRKKQNGGVCGRRKEIEDYHLKIVDKSAISLLSCGISRSHCATNNNNNR